MRRSILPMDRSEIVSPLQNLMIQCYESEKAGAKVPEFLVKELANNCLVISDMDITDGEVAALSKFMASKLALRHVETIVVRLTTARAIEFRKTNTKYENRLDPPSALIASGGRLLRSLKAFIGRCTALNSIVIEAVKLPVEFYSSLGAAISASKSGLRWLAFRDVAMGDAGLRLLTPHISKLHLQVLVFERCGLTDESSNYIATIMKAQEAMLDTMFWNSTLRSEHREYADIAIDKQNEETSHVFSAGLVALSINGNAFTDVGMLPISRALRRNYWLLGINLADNKFDYEGIRHLIHSLGTNRAIHAVLLGKNAGFDKEAAGRVASVTAAVALRLDLLPEGVSLLLRRWMRLQLAELAFVSGSGNNGLAAGSGHNGFAAAGDADADFLNNGGKEDSFTFSPAAKATAPGTSSSSRAAAASLDASHVSADPYSVAAADPADPFLTRNQMRPAEDGDAPSSGAVEAGYHNHHNHHGNDTYDNDTIETKSRKAGNGLRNGNSSKNRNRNGLLYMESDLFDVGDDDGDGILRREGSFEFEYAIPTPPARDGRAGGGNGNGHGNGNGSTNSNAFSFSPGSGGGAVDNDERGGGGGAGRASAASVVNDSVQHQSQQEDFFQEDWASPGGSPGQPDVNGRPPSRISLRPRSSQSAAVQPSATEIGSQPTGSSRGRTDTDTHRDHHCNDPRHSYGDIPVELKRPETAPGAVRPSRLAALGLGLLASPGNRNAVGGVHSQFDGEDLAAGGGMAWDDDGVDEDGLLIHHEQYHQQMQLRDWLSADVEAAAADSSVAAGAGAGGGRYSSPQQAQRRPSRGSNSFSRSSFDRDRGSAAAGEGGGRRISPQQQQQQWQQQRGSGASSPSSPSRHRFKFHALQGVQRYYGHKGDRRLLPENVKAIQDLVRLFDVKELRALQYLKRELAEAVEPLLSSTRSFVSVYGIVEHRLRYQDSNNDGSMSQYSLFAALRHLRVEPSVYFDGPRGPLSEALKDLKERGAAIKGESLILTDDFLALLFETNTRKLLRSRSKLRASVSMSMSRSGRGLLSQDDSGGGRSSRHIHIHRHRSRSPSRGGGGGANTSSNTSSRGSGGSPSSAQRSGSGSPKRPTRISSVRRRRASLEGEEEGHIHTETQPPLEVSSPLRSSPPQSLSHSQRHRASPDPSELPAAVVEAVAMTTEMLTAFERVTHGLAMVTSQLKDVSESLSESMSMTLNLSAQQNHMSAILPVGDLFSFDDPRSPLRSSPITTAAATAAASSSSTRGMSRVGTPSPNGSKLKSAAAAGSPSPSPSSRPVPRSSISASPSSSWRPSASSPSQEASLHKNRAQVEVEDRVNNSVDLDETFDDDFGDNDEDEAEAEAALTEEELDLIKDRLRRRLKSILRP